MKIVFLCGSLEIGKDGVGDYTRRLSGELIRQGHSVSIIALYDRSISIITHETQSVGVIPIETLRIPYSGSEKQRLIHTKKWIIEFDPEWLSLQFVPFSFHSKGLPFNLSKLLLEVGEGRLWHIMFHELWVGIANDFSIKNKLWEVAQKFIIKNLLWKLKPSKIHTQSKLYQFELAKCSFSASCLPLFSNIDKSNIVIDTSSQTLNEKQNSLVMFGSIHPGAPVDKLATEISEYCKKNNTVIVVKFIGRTGDQQGLWTEVLKTAGLSIEVFGEQPPEMISKILTEARIGISTTSITHIEKSGTVAAMLQHGLPVLCVTKPKKVGKLINFYAHEGILEYKPGNFEEFFLKRPAVIFKNTVESVSFQFLESLLSS